MLSRISVSSSPTSLSSRIRSLRSARVPRLTAPRSLNSLKFTCSSSASARSLAVSSLASFKQQACLRRFSTKSNEEEQAHGKSEPLGDHLRAGPGSGESRASPEQIMEYLRASEKKKNRLLFVAIAAFLALDISLALVWYLSSDDPQSDNYVPPDWPQLVAANFGLASPPSAAPQFTGHWKEVDGGSTLSFGERGQYSSVHNIPGTDNVLSHSSGKIFAVDNEFITVKVTTTEKIRIDSQPIATDEGWFMKVDGKVFKKTGNVGTKL